MSDVCEVDFNAAQAVDFKRKLQDAYQNLLELKEVQNKKDFAKIIEENRWIESSSYAIKFYVLFHLDPRLKCKEHANAKRDQLNSVHCEFVDKQIVPLRRISIKETKVTCFEGGKKGVEQKTQAILLSEATALPKMTSWLPIQHNILVEDENVSF